MKDIIKKSWTIAYYMIYPKVQQKEKKAKYIVDDAMVLLDSLQSDSSHILQILLHMIM